MCFIAPRISKLRLASKTIPNGEDDEGKEVGCEARRGKARQ